MLNERQYSFASYSYVGGVPNLPQTRMERIREPDVTGGRIARNTHYRNVSSSILDKFPVGGVISDVSTPRKYPAHVVGAVTSDIHAASITSATRPPPGPSPTSLAGPVQPAYRRRERNLLIHGCGKPWLFISCSLPALRRRPRQSARAKLLLSSPVARN